MRFTARRSASSAFGDIGACLAKLCRAFDMTVLAYDPLRSADQIAARGGTKVFAG